MNLDAVAERAARALLDTAVRDTADVDTDKAIDTLHRVGRRRTAQRGMVAVTIGLVAAAWGLQLSGDSGHGRPEPAPAVDFPPLDDGYEVIASAVSPSGKAASGGHIPGGSDRCRHRPHPRPEPIRRRVERADPSRAGRPQRALPHGRGLGPGRIQDRHPGRSGAGAVDAIADPVELTLVTANPDGTARQSVAEMGRCACVAALPTLTWSGDQVEINIPDGPDQGHYTQEMP